MLKRFLLCKFSGGRRRLSAAFSNFSFGNGREGLNSRCHERVDTSVTSSFKGILGMGSSRKLHVGIASPNQLLEFPRHEVDTVENQKTSSNTGEDDEFAELGSLMLDGTGSGYNPTTEDVVEDLKMSRNSTIEGLDDFAGFCLSMIKGAGSGFNPKLHVGIASPNQLLEFPRHEVDTVENQKTSSNTGEDDEFAELGSLMLDGTGSGYNLTTEDVVEDLKTSRNSTIEGVDDFAGFCISMIKGAGSGFNPKSSSSASATGENGVVDSAESLKTSSTSTAGQDDDFAELGSSALEAAGSGINLTSKNVVENLKTSGNSTIEVIDDLAGLDPSVSEGAGSELNLTTEKREDAVHLGRRLKYNESQKARKTSKGQHPQSSLSRNPTKDYCHPDKHFDVEGLKLASQKKTESGNNAHAADNNESHTQLSHSILITGIPPDISLQELKEKLLNYGDILCASMRAGNGGLARCLVKFKRMKSQRKAVAAKWVTLKNYRLQIHSSCLKTSSTSTAGQDDDFAELGSSGLEAAGSGINLTSEDVVEKEDVVENLKTSGNSTIEEIDDLAGLDPSVSEGAASELNLTTEKREDAVHLGRRLRYNESQKARKTYKGQHPQSSLSRNPTKDYCHPDKHFDVEGLNLASQKKTESGNKAHAADNNESHTQHSHSILITGIPPDISLQELKEKLLDYGEILCASMRAGNGGLARCLVKFKRMKSQRKAVAAKWVTLKNYRLQIRSSCFEFLTIRISNISTATGEGFIHLTCRKYGDVSGLVRTEDGAVDVEFKVEDISVSKSILKHLNDVSMDDCRWSAKLLPELDEISTIEVLDPQWRVGSQISSLLDSIQERNRMQKIYLEDLEYLHDAVTHLKDRPPELHNMLDD